MLIEEKSKYYLKKIRAKAKMYEYHIPDSLHSDTEKQVNQLIISAIAIIGDFSNDIIDSIEGKEFDYKEYQENLRFAAKFFDGYVDSKLYSGDEDYYLLLGAVVYYLCDYNGSSHVLVSRIANEIDLGINGIDRVLVQILAGNSIESYEGKYPILNDIINNYNQFNATGIFANYKYLKDFRKTVYEIGSDRELLFADALVAIVYLKIKNSSYELMPKYTGVAPEVWHEVLRKGTLVTELWQSQRELGKNEVFQGKSATIQMPTSSGKTKSIALIILSAFLSKRTNYAIVVAPFRALCREITEELENAFSFDENIKVNELSDVLQMDILDILFGNNSNSEEQSVYVVTPEKLLFVLRQNIAILSNVGLMIFDEGHLFDDLNRGIAYELLISTIKLYMPNDTQKVLISAVIPNAQEINGWLMDGNGVVVKNNVIQTTEKTVSIADTIFDQENKKLYIYLYFINPDRPDEEEFYVPRVITQTEIQRLGKETKVRVFPEINNGGNKNKNDVAIALAINLCINGGTTIFCGKKQTADKILERVLDIETRGYDISNIKKNTDNREIEKISHLIEKHFGTDNVYYLVAQKGAFAHHGGIPMGLRSSIEYAMQKGAIQFLACTSTLAQGVNLPIRYLIIPTVYQSKERIKVRDFQNLIGRAGRAGIYTEGSIILSETHVYSMRKDFFRQWKWLNYKELLNCNQAEACTSELLAWLRVDDEMEEYLDTIIDIFEKHYVSGDFVKEVDNYLSDLIEAKEETYNKAKFIVTQMVNNIEAIESFLLFYLIEDTYDDSKDTIHDIIRETLAYYLATDDERKRLLHLVDLIGSFIVKTVATPDKRNRYSKSLLGVRKEIEIEQWIEEHIFDIACCENEEELLKVLFPLLITSDYPLIHACNKPDELVNVGIKWILGENYVDILQYAIENNIRILQRHRYSLISLKQVIDLCDNYFGYNCTLMMAAIIENVNYHLDDTDLNSNLKLLSKRMRYGLKNQCSITLYEMGFNDRIIAKNLAEIIEKEYRAGSRKEIIRLIKRTVDIQYDVLSYLSEYPSYFEEKAIKLIFG